MRNNNTNTAATKSIADEAMAPVPVTKKAAVEAFHRLQEAQGVTHPAPKSVAMKALVCWGFDGTVGGLRKALKALANEDTVKTRLEAVKLPAAGDVRPVEVETPAKEESGADAAVATTPVAVVKLNEPAESDADTPAEPTPEPTPVAETDPAPTESPDAIADRLPWRAEVPKAKALKLLALAFSGEEELSAGELLDWLNDDETPLPDFKDRLDDWGELVPLPELREMLVDAAALGQEFRAEA